MKRFVLNVSWTMVATVIVEAESEDAAIRTALDVGSLPGGEYLGDSFTVDSIREEGDDNPV